MIGRARKSPKATTSFTQKSTRMSSSSSRWFVLFQSWTGELLSPPGRPSNQTHRIRFFSVDICQFSLTSLFQSSEDKNRTISFRSIVLIMTYAGTIILNLLAASIDSNFTASKAQPSENSTMAAMMESMEDNDSVLVEQAKCKFLLAIWYSFDSFHILGERRHGLLMEYFINCAQLRSHRGLAHGLFDEQRSSLQRPRRNGQIPRPSLKLLPRCTYKKFSLLPSVPFPASLHSETFRLPR